METRLCVTCLTSKPETEFYKRSGTGTYRRTCKTCYKRDHKPHPPSDWRRRVKARLMNEAGGKCIDCGYTGPPYHFDFDHRDPTTKLFNISHFKAGYAKLNKEVQKCDLVCALCHRTRTHRQRCSGCIDCRG